LFEDVAAKGKSAELMKTIDSINGRYGKTLVQSAATGTKKSWEMRSGNKSPNYTTNWSQLPFAY
jgi:DNA polymerase V